MTDPAAPLTHIMDGSWPAGVVRGGLDACAAAVKTHPTSWATKEVLHAVELDLTKDPIVARMKSWPKGALKT